VTQYSDQAIPVRYPVGTGGVIKGRAVKLGSAGDAGKVIAVTAAADVIVGVAQHSAAAGEHVSVVVDGVVEALIADATVGVLDQLTITSNGQFAKQLAPLSQVTATWGYSLEQGVAAVGSDVRLTKIKLLRPALPAIPDPG